MTTTHISYKSGRRELKKGKDFKKPEGKEFKKSEPICYECKKPGHIKVECLKLKKIEFRKKDSSKKLRKYKKKAMAAAWDNNSDSDSESSSSEEEEEKANMAFMANIEEKIPLPQIDRSLARDSSHKLTTTLLLVVQVCHNLSTRHTNGKP
ncbi:hypothetical protein Taro_006849 [Colocasia esculenta]|uniref:CCHC-type domain-containing protein n=1 Tax=Colocasia esculenta TaxID=4460 RepID=A0A843TTV9_COLES|nr:hypothetical protein [Colocasia esculenta]